MDQSLHCDAMDCMHNLERRCNANIIQVNGGGTSRGENTYCNTYVSNSDDYSRGVFERMREQGFPESRVDTEFGNDMQAVTEAPKITCTAGRCAYNFRYYCHAKTVDIEAPREDGSMRCECDTFRPK